MKLLLDTHLLLWSCMADQPGLERKVSTEFTGFVEDIENELYYSAVSVWEVAIKQSRGRTDFQVDPHTFRRESPGEPNRA